MALSVGELFASLTLNKKDFDAGLSAAKRALFDTEKSARSTEGVVARLNSTFKQVATTAAGFVVAQVGMRAVGAAINYVKSSAIGLNDMLQQTRIGFTTMLGSAKAADIFLRQLADFAKRTPFEFPELVVAAQRMKAYGFAAEEVIPLLTDVGNVSAGLGAGAEGINRMTLALGQMAAKGKVQTQELLQLTELGIPAFEILAQGIGKTVAETQDLVSKGQIASDTFLRLFHEWSQANFGGMMEQQSRTFSGAVSNITDSLQMASARAFRPFFDLLTEGAIYVAEFLDSERFARWEAIVEAVMQRAADGLRNLVTAVATGDWDRIFGGVLQRLSDFASSMYSGALAAVRSYAQGLVDGAAHYVAVAAQYIADVIASLLIGHSPPERGPLSEIDRGGQRVMEAYGEGMQAGLGPVYAAVEQAAEAFRTLDTTAALEDARRGLEAARDNVQALEEAAESAESTIRSLDRAAAEIESQMRAIRREADDIRESYEDQIRPLEEQLELIRDVVSLEEKRRDMALSLQEIEATRARIQALGDPELRAQLLEQLTLIQQRQEEHQIAREMREIEQRIAEARKEGKDVDIRGLELRLEELRVRQQMLALVDEEALARAEADQARIDAQQQLNDLDEREKQIKADILALPLEEQVKQLKREQQEAIKPLEAQLRVLQRQREDLEEQRRQWQMLKRDISDALEPLQAAGGGRGGGGRGGGGGLSLPAIAADGPRLPTLALEDPEGVVEGVGEQLGRGILDGMVNYVREHVGRMLGGAIGAGLGRLAGGLVGKGVGRLLGGAVGSLFGPVGTIIGTLIGTQIGDAVQEELARRDLGPAFRDLWNKLKSGDIGGASQAVVEVMSRVWDMIREQGPGLIQAGVDLIAKWGAWASTEGLAKVIETTASWGAALVDWVAPRIPDLLREGGALMERLGEWALNEFLPFWAGKLAEWGQALVDWVRPRIGPLLGEMGALLGDLGEWMITVALPAIIGKLWEWGQALVDWVKPRIPELIQKADELKDSLTTWIKETALPKIKEKLKEWGAAFLDWVKDEVLPKIDEKLDEVPEAIRKWFDEGGKDKVKAVASSIGHAMVEAIVDGIWEKLPSLMSTLTTVLSLANPANLVTNVASRVVSGVAARQHGGTVRPGELTIVGETGPELVRLPAGSTVYPSSLTRAILAMSGGGRVSMSPVATLMAGGGADAATVAYAVDQALERRFPSDGALMPGMGPVADITLINQLDGREVSRAVLRNLYGRVRVGVSGNVG